MNDVDKLNNTSEFCGCYSLHALPWTETGHTVEWKKAFHIAAKHPWILIMPANLKVLVEKGKELEGRTSAADIVREMEGEGEMTLQRKKGGREEDRMIQERGNQICWKQEALTHYWHISIACTWAWHTVKCYPTCFDMWASRLVLR